MVEKFESLGEVAHALQGIRAELSLHKMIFAGAVALGVASVGALYLKMDTVEDSTARIETRLDAIEGKLDQIVADAGYIRDNIQTAALPVAPAKDVFPGYVGFEIEASMEPEKFNAMLGGFKDGPIWVYAPER